MSDVKKVSTDQL